MEDNTSLNKKTELKGSDNNSILLSVILLSYGLFPSLLNSLALLFAPFLNICYLWFRQTNKIDNIEAQRKWVDEHMSLANGERQVLWAKTKKSIIYHFCEQQWLSHIAVHSEVSTHIMCPNGFHIY